MIEVSSSNVKAVDHDGSDLLVAFRNGSLYRYYSVPYHKFRVLLAADSKGGHLHSHIKPYHRCSRIR